MRRSTVFLLMLMCLSSCGYTSRDNQVVGQVKSVINRTLLVCYDYVDAELIVGFLRTGIASMSVQDIHMQVENPGDVKTLQAAVQSGKLVQVTYDAVRLNICGPVYHMTNVQILP